MVAGGGGNVEGIISHMWVKVRNGGKGREQGNDWHAFSMCIAARLRLRCLAKDKHHQWPPVLSSIKNSLETLSERKQCRPRKGCELPLTTHALCQAFLVG